MTRPTKCTICVLDFTAMVFPMAFPPTVNPATNADISKARELLGYDPEYDFAKGINLAIDWYKENL